MDIWKFDKTVIERYDECCMALKFEDNIIAASKIHAAWEYYFQAVVEPCGWQALWKLSRVFCEEINIRYPTVVFGSVEQICFEESKAVFKVEAVQDDDINLQIETHYVNLEDLYPIKNQENQALNVKKTAEAIDNYRFFVTHIWMPWDAENDDPELDFIDSHFITRAQLYCDMKNKKMSRNSIAKLKLLTNEAREIDLKRRELEVEVLSDDEEEKLDDASKAEARLKQKQLIKLNMRMNQIRVDFESLENPKMREIIEEELNEQRSLIKSHYTIVTKPGNIQDQMTYLESVKSILGKDENVYLMPSLQEALFNSDPSDTIFVAHTQHKIKFPVPMSSGGEIKAILDNQFKAIISSKMEDDFLFVCDGDFSFENLTFDCRSVEIGILVRSSAKVTLKNCHIIGSKAASIQRGISVIEKGELILEDCIFEDHSTAVSITSPKKTSLKNCQFLNCKYGLDISDKGDITLENVNFENMEVIGISMETETVTSNGDGNVDIKGNPSFPAIEFKGDNKGSMRLIKNQDFKIFIEESESTDVEMKAYEAEC